MAGSIMADFAFEGMHFITNYLVPGLLAVLFGGAIGFQREKTDRPAGLRTHSLVCLGSTTFTLISYLGFSSLGVTDFSRIAAGVVTGIGFIGAGAIFRRGPLVKGVTTAASIWIVAAIGMALGVKLYYLALLVTVLSYIILTAVKYFEDRFVSLPSYSIKITAGCKLSDFRQVDKILNEFSTIRSRVIKTGEQGDTLDILINASSRAPDFSIIAAQKLKDIQHIKNIEISNF